MKIFLSILFLGAALVTFTSAVFVVALYRWLTKDEPRLYPSSDEFCAPEGAWGSNVRPAVAFVSKPKREHPRQTVADVVTFNAYRAARKRGQA